MNTTVRRKLPIYLDTRFALILAVVSFFLAFLSAAAHWGEIRLVDLLLLFFGGFGAGAGVTAAVVRHRFHILVKKPPGAARDQESVRVRRGPR